MKYIYTLIFLFIISSCNEEKVLLPVVGVTVTNLHAPTTSRPGEPPAGTYVLYSFAKEDTVSDNSWDIALRATDILVNGGVKGGSEEPERTGKGGAYIASDAYFNVKEAPADTEFKQDSQNDTAIPRGSENGWYIYNSQTYVVSPIAGKILIIKTHDGKFAKMKINSYYKDSPESPNGLTDQGQHYSFVFTYQPNEGLRSFE